jgi:hypothetical protein
VQIDKERGPIFHPAPPTNKAHLAEASPAEASLAGASPVENVSSATTQLSMRPAHVMLRGILDTRVTSTSRDCILLAKAGETAAVVYRQRLPQKR